MNSSPSIVAADVGSQSIRCTVISVDGDTLSQTASQLPLPFDHQGQPIPLSGDVLWAGLQDTLKTCLQSISPPAAAICVTTQRAGSIGLDAAGEALTPLLRWNEVASVVEPEPLPWFWRLPLTLAGASGLVRNFQRRCPASRIAREQPRRWEEIAHWLSVSAYLNYRLSGHFNDCNASQVGYLPFNFKRLGWRRRGHWQWYALPLQRWQLPRLYPPASRLGQLRARIAGELGLAAATPVVACGPDKACESLGAGADSPGKALISLGTAVSISAYSPRYRSLRRFQPGYPAADGSGYQLEYQLPRGLWLARVMLQLAGHSSEQTEVLQSWLQQSRAGDIDPLPLARALDRRPDQAYRLLQKQIELQGLAGCFQSLVDGLLLDLKQGYEFLRRRTRQQTLIPVVAGGGSANETLLIRLASCLQQTLLQPSQPECSSLGAAITGAVSIGAHQNFPAAVRAMTPTMNKIEPDDRWVSYYQELWRSFDRCGQAPPHPLAEA